MPEKAVISHRGEKYEIGRGKRFYGIWVAGAPYDEPVDRWPENPVGWQQAWSRFTAIEVPGTIKPVTRAWKGPRLGPRASSDTNPADSASHNGEAAGARSRRGSRLLIGEGLLVLGVVLGLAGLFPTYEGGQSLLSQSDQVVPHLLYVIGWALTAAFVALSVARASGAARVGALFGLGLSAVTFGLFLADWGELGGSVKLGSGLVIATLGWLACTAGGALVLGACRGQAGPGELPSRPVHPGREHAGPVALLVLAAIGTAVAFVPSWDSYVLAAKAVGTTRTLTEGYAFDNPGLAIAGNVCVMVAVVAVATTAALWRPSRHGAWLLAGAIVPLAAQVVSAIIGAGQPASPAMFGISQAEASSLGLTISSGLTGIFWVYFVFVISLFVSCAWLFTEPGRPVMPGIPLSPWHPVAGGPGTPGASDAAVSEDADRDDADRDASEDADSDDADSGSGTVDSDAVTDDGGQSAYA